MALVCVVSSVGKPPGENVCCLREKKHAIALLLGRIIALNTEMVERGNFVREFHYQQLRKRTNIWSCLLPSPFCYSEWYIHYHETGKSKACYRSGKRWCTSFRKNVNKTLATKTTYKKSGEKTLDILKGFHLLLHILGLQTSPFTK